MSGWREQPDYKPTAVPPWSPSRTWREAILGARARRRARGPELDSRTGRGGARPSVSSLNQGGRETLSPWRGKGSGDVAEVVDLGPGVGAPGYTGAPDAAG